MVTGGGFHRPNALSVTQIAKAMNNGPSHLLQMLSSSSAFSYDITASSDLCSGTGKFIVASIGRETEAEYLKHWFNQQFKWPLITRPHLAERLAQHRNTAQPLARRLLIPQSLSLCTQHNNSTAIVF